MKQLQQSLKDGLTEIIDVPLPGYAAGEIRIRSRCSLISAGTERMLVNFGKANLIDKARQQPDKVRQVLQKAKTDGVQATLKAVQSKLNEPIAMGYSQVGVIDALGTKVGGFSCGDRVVSNGSHAEIVVVPENLVARIPDNVTDEAASFTVVSAIALQGVRLAEVSLGERVAVIGLGLIGLLTVQLLRAQGCQVIGLDYDAEKLALAREFGAKTVNLSSDSDAVDEAMIFSQNQGVDAVLITAATDSAEPIKAAAQMSRQRGRVILVGVADLALSRDDFYKKELSFQVSCSYGPGRYDPSYEEKGQDYPFGFVRWTEQRNFQAVLQLMADGKLDVLRLITHRFAFEEAAKAYALLNDAKASPIGMMLAYQHSKDGAAEAASIQYAPVLPAYDGQPQLAFIGAGNYAKNVLIPAFKSAKAGLQSVSSRHGVSAANVARQFSFAEATSDIESQIVGPAQALIITTRHDSHAGLVLAGLKAGKHIFVEKPLCLSHEDLAEIESFAQGSTERPVLMVGFNRRFSPLVQKMKTLLSQNTAPKSFIYTINAGAIPRDHWTQDSQIGGGRIVGEACHFIDLVRFLAGEAITDIVTSKMECQTNDVATITLSFANGSIGTVHYVANGHRSVAKERLEVFCDGKILQLDNFRKLIGFGWKNFSSQTSRSQDKGQAECARRFLDAIMKGAPEPIALEELLEVARFSLHAAHGTS